MVSIRSNSRSLRMRIKNRKIIAFHLQALFYHTRISGGRLFPFAGVNVDVILYGFWFLPSRQNDLEINFNPKLLPTVERCFPRSSPDASPLLFATFATFFPKHLAQPISPPDGMEYPKRISHICLPRGIRSNQDTEGAEAQCSVPKVFEVVE